MMHQDNEHQCLELLFGVVRFCKTLLWMSMIKGGVSTVQIWLWLQEFTWLDLNYPGNWLIKQSESDWSL
jgi:hypothetical protein